MADVDPLKPGHIEGQNPNTPERLQGEMKVGSGRPGSFYVMAGVFVALAIGILLMFGTAWFSRG